MTTSIPEGFLEIRRGGRLLFQYDPERGLVRIKPKGRPVELVDLRQYGLPLERNQHRGQRCGSESL